jgi:peptidoglycan/LPS O-acetylase OafA/YrhL
MADDVRTLPAGDRLRSLDGLRGVAAIVVMLHLPSSSSPL